MRHAIHKSFDTEFWEGEKTFRVAASGTDYHLAYIDFLDRQRTRPRLPISLLLNGCGTFNSPYAVSYDDDPYAQQIGMFADKVPLFFANLNTLLSKLSFYKLNRQAMKDLADVVDWIDQGNKALFNRAGVKATLYLFENAY